ncbi:MAG: quinone-dependent dihydroorotate dehydrogenase [Sulfurovaceae bacterium]|nr:quinone-dependent dihydroorotate dehydrogenase [Sulfurovaceae bacterium]MDD5360331.1 quinone-dependent dihydroorotate dehydrogenase [Sulfurovaceae bacterium]
MQLCSYQTAKKILFLLNPENAHGVINFCLRLAEKLPFLQSILSKMYVVSSPMLRQNIFGKTFENPVGLGAGFDKNSDHIETMKSLGFGFTEVGTITPLAQDGNPKPRLFRLIEEKSIQNAMGFNNKGMEHTANVLAKYKNSNFPIGINIGKNKITSEDDALSDYEKLIKRLSDFGDYMVINISSPNTPGLRNLQNEEFINSLFTMAKKLTKKPILLKIAPDMNNKEAINLCKIAISAGASGIIATNTTIDYSLTPNAKDFGGISGELLKIKSRKLFKAIGKEFFGKTLLISVGGIDSAKEAYERIKDGATLIQVYSMLVYEGPALIKNINNGLIELLKADGYTNISQAIGANCKK